ncbi:DNA polymerase III subunit delta [Sulfoacidibacillus thermotolerans]|uniref:DNA polymerase III subunit delta n=1 Tax=Sulfoacidibacillus thermotolerans TaxID=1765684 RepID=A0A2U3D7C4_SULT2|nr:DNA polymerase III subunit delta [Sulfoacidibacillus thermotolerans]PWI57182.1 DNA polymerase III subunit delta [Sulfoacidibacillus thermotolerans]
MQSSFYEAIHSIRKGKYGGVYVLVGVSDGYAGQWLAQELQAVLEKETITSAVEIAKYSLLTESFGQIVSDHVDGGLFGTRSIALCVDFDVLTTTYKGKAKESELLQVFEWLLEHSLETPMVLTTSAEKLDERKKITKKLRDSKNATMIDTAKHTPKEWREIARMMLNHTLILEEEQLDRLLVRTGNSLGLLAQEIEKVKTYAGDRTTVSSDELDELVVDARQVEIFDVVKSFVEQKYSLAAQLYDRVEDRSLFAFLALLARQYRLIARVGEEVKSGVRSKDQELAAMLGVHPYAIKVAREQARRISVENAKREIEAIANLEYAVKSGGLSEKTALDLWFLHHMVHTSA